jgi:hypothetical protein
VETLNIFAIFINAGEEVPYTDEDLMTLKRMIDELKLRRF